MFKDNEEGKTHYFGDGCIPPHKYDNMCKHNWKEDRTSDKDYIFCLTCGEIKSDWD